MKIGAIIQARTGSTRLSGKVLMELPQDSGVTCLQQVIRRAKKGKVNEVIVATTKNNSDDIIVQIAKDEGVKYYRGETDDVLNRYYEAAKENNIYYVVRITSDCPCIDPKIITKVVNTHLDGEYDYTSNNLIRTYPQGLDVEVFNFNVLEYANFNAKSKYDREHVTPYIRNNYLEFYLKNVLAPLELTCPNINISLDNTVDLMLLRKMFDKLYPTNPFFDAYDIVQYLKEGQ